MKILAVFDIYGSEREINKKIFEIKNDLEITNEEFKKKLNKSLFLKFISRLLKKEQKETFELLKKADLIENYKIDEKEVYENRKRYVLSVSLNEIWIKFYISIQEASIIKIIDEKKLKERVIKNFKKDLKKRADKLIEIRAIE